MIPNKPTVEFDPENPEHVSSIKSMIDNGKRNSDLRFHLGPEDEISGTFTSTMAKALYLMAYRYMDLMEKQTGTSTDAEQNSSHAAHSVVRQLPMRQSGQQVQLPIVGLPGRIEQTLSPKTDAKKLH